MELDIMNTATLEAPTKLPLNTYQKEDIINRLVLNEPQRSIASDHDISQPSVSEIKKANETRIAILKEQLIKENTDNIQESIRLDIENNKEISRKFKETGEIASELVAYKSATQKNIIKPLLESVGIYPSNTINYGDTNIQTNVVITESYQAFLDYQSTHQDNSGDIIDIDADNGDDKRDNGNDTQ